jgi:hypothetical protein
MIKNLSGIDTNREEGRLLIAAVSILTVQPQLILFGQGKKGTQISPDEMVGYLHQKANDIFPKHEER